MFNIQYMRNSTIIYPVKIEYGPEINIFILKMIIKSGLEKVFLKFLDMQANIHEILK